MESISTQTTNDEPKLANRAESVSAIEAVENKLARLADDFTAFKKFIHSGILLIKANQEKVHSPGLSPPWETLNYEKAFIKSLETRILSLERQFDQKQATIHKLLVNNHLQAQVQQLTQKGRENASEKTETRERSVPNEMIRKRWESIYPKPDLQQKKAKITK